MRCDMDWQKKPEIVQKTIDNWVVLQCFYAAMSLTALIAKIYIKLVQMDYWCWNEKWVSCPPHPHSNTLTLGAFR